MDLHGKLALVTGAARGLGRAVAVALADAGCDVAVSDIARDADGATPYTLASGDDLAETARAVAQRGRRSAAITADVTSAADVGRMMAETERRLGGLDILIANAGIIAAGPVAAMDEAQWDRIFAVNVKGVFLSARAAIPLLGKRGGGRIVTIASVAGKTGRGGLLDVDVPGRRHRDRQEPAQRARSGRNDLDSFAARRRRVIFTVVLPSSVGASCSPDNCA